MKLRLIILGLVVAILHIILSVIVQAEAVHPGANQERCRRNVQLVWQAGEGLSSAAGGR